MRCLSCSYVEEDSIRIKNSIYTTAMFRSLAIALVLTVPTITRKEWRVHRMDDFPIRYILQIFLHEMTDQAFYTPPLRQFQLFYGVEKPLYGSINYRFLIYYL